jgi:hypothetical protein
MSPSCHPVRATCLLALRKLKPKVPPTTNRWGEPLPTHCQKGHLYTPANTAMEDGARRCRKCKSERNRTYRAKKPYVNALP